MVRVRKTARVLPLKSWVWQHFTKGTVTGKEDVDSCIHCTYTYVNKLKDGSTSAHKHHLLKKHCITQPNEPESKSKDKKSVRITPVVAWHKKSLAEWLCILVIEDGISFNAIKQSRFFKAAFHHMGLSAYLSHNSIKKSAFNYLDQCKEKVKADIKAKMAAGIKYAVVADEWSSISSRHYMNVCITTADTTIGLGMVR